MPARRVERLANPQTHFSLAEFSVRLDRMNIIRPEGTHEESKEPTFHRVPRGREPARIVHLTRFPRPELLEDREGLRGIEKELWPKARVYMMFRDSQESPGHHHPDDSDQSC